jgi:hypothetical protein
MLVKARREQLAGEWLAKETDLSAATKDAP